MSDQENAQPEDIEQPLSNFPEGSETTPEKPARRRSPARKKKTEESASSANETLSAPSEATSEAAPPKRRAPRKKKTEEPDESAQASAEPNLARSPRRRAKTEPSAEEPSVPRRRKRNAAPLTLSTDEPVAPVESPVATSDASDAPIATESASLGDLPSDENASETPALYVAMASQAEAAQTSEIPEFATDQEAPPVEAETRTSPDDDASGVAAFEDASPIEESVASTLDEAMEALPTETVESPSYEEPTTVSSETPEEDARLLDETPSDAIAPREETPNDAAEESLMPVESASDLAVIEPYDGVQQDSPVAVEEAVEEAAPAEIETEIAETALPVQSEIPTESVETESIDQEAVDFVESSEDAVDSEETADASSDGEFVNASEETGESVDLSEVAEEPASLSTEEDSAFEAIPDVNAAEEAAILPSDAERATTADEIISADAPDAADSNAIFDLEAFDTVETPLNPEESETTEEESSASEESPAPRSRRRSRRRLRSGHDIRADKKRAEEEENRAEEILPLSDEEPEIDPAFLSDAALNLSDEAEAALKDDSADESSEEADAEAGDSTSARSRRRRRRRRRRGGLTLRDDAEEILDVEIEAETPLTPAEPDAVAPVEVEPEEEIAAPEVVPEDSEETSGTERRYHRVRQPSRWGKRRPAIEQAVIVNPDDPEAAPVRIDIQPGVGRALIGRSIIGFREAYDIPGDDRPRISFQVVVLDDGSQWKIRGSEEFDPWLEMMLPEDDS